MGKNVLWGPDIVLGIMPIFCLIYYNQNIITILQTGVMEAK